MVLAGRVPKFPEVAIGDNPNMEVRLMFLNPSPTKCLIPFCSKAKLAISSAVISLLLITASAPAATILFDFQNDTTTDIATGAVAVADLTTPKSGTFGSLTVTLTASVGNDLGNSRDRGANTGPASDITRDFIQWVTGDPRVITISGLTANQEYAFTIWSGDLAANQIKTTNHTIAGASGGGTVQHTSVSLASENAATGTSLHQVTLPNVFSTATGTLTYTIDYVSGGGAAATLNGMRLEIIPEPASLALAGLGGLLIFGRSRRR